MRNNKGYILTLKDAVVSNDLLNKLISSKYYIPSRNAPLRLFKGKDQFDEIDNAMRPGFRMNGFVILNFNKNEEAQLINFVKTSLNNDEFIKQSLKENEIIDAKEVPYKTINGLLKEVNEILALELKKEDILKISEIKIIGKVKSFIKEMTKEEKMTNNIPSIRIIISSPEDVSEDREKARVVVNKIEKGFPFSKKFNIHCETYNWEDKFDEKKFEPLLKKTIPFHNIYIFILWKSFSLKNDNVASKIEAELKEILVKYQNIEPDKLGLMFYFKESDIPQNEILNEHKYKQFLKVNDFKLEAQMKEISTIYNENEFKIKFREYIVNSLNKIIAPSVEDEWEKKFKESYKNSIEKDIKEYKKSSLLKQYIELNALDFKDKPMGRLIHAVDVNIESGKPVAVIGEFGSGKTTFTRYYEYKKKYEWLESSEVSREVSRYVLLLDLNEYSRKRYTLNMINWIIDHVKQKIGYELKKWQFEKLLIEKKLILIFDGLDEIANIPGENTINKNISKIIKISHNESPIIITSRKAFLESEVEQRNLKSCIRIYIDKLDIQQVIDFVNTIIPGNKDAFIDFIFGLEPDLLHVFDRQEEDKIGIREIVRKPLFLYMMIRIYQKGYLRNINTPAELYEFLTDDWIREEIEKKETSIKKSEVMKQIIQELAFKMLIDNQFSYTHEELKKIIHTILDKLSNTLKQKFDYDVVLTDITNASFLVRDNVEKNNFAFPHRSFIEYFTAYKLALELEERNIKNFAIRIFYEEIFEFLSWIMTEKTGKDDDLTAVLGDSQFPFKARVNAIPPLRKQRNKKAIEPLLRAHIDIDSGHHLLQFVCGYTLAIFQEMFPEEFKHQKIKDLLTEAYKKEKNALIRVRIALLLTGGEYKKDEYEEHSLDYKFSSSSLEEILEPKGTIEAYDKILKVNREHPIVLEESVRILTIYLMFKPEAVNFKNTLLRYIFNYQHIHERIRRICLWSIDKLGLLEPKNKRKETLEIKRKSKNIVEKSLKDTNSSVHEMAKYIIAKYPKIFIIGYEKNHQE